MLSSFFLEGGVLSSTQVLPLTVNPTGLSTSYGPGSGLFVWTNPAAPTIVGTNTLRVWLGDNPTATPGSGDAVAATIAAINGNGRTNLWGMNILAGQTSGGVGALQGPVTGLEIDVYSDTAWTVATRMDQANPVTCLQLYNSPSVSMVTNALSIWSADATGNHWFWEGVSLSRYKNYGLHFYHISGDPSSVASVFDESNANYSYKAVGSYVNGIDLTGATLSTTAFASPGFSVTSLGLISMSGTEGSQLAWSLGGQTWKANVQSGGSWYLFDQTHSRFPFSAAINGGGITSDTTITATAFKVGTSQVVGARVTGYTAMTGTADKASAFATSSVTLAQLAGRVMQLQADLTTHGLIGA